MGNRRPRWSPVSLRTKGLLVVLLPALPAAFFCLLLGVALARAPVAAGRDAASRMSAEQVRRVRRVQVSILAASVTCVLAGGLLSLWIGRGIQRRLALLATGAERLSRDGSAGPLPSGDDEIGRLGRTLGDTIGRLRRREDDLLTSQRQLDRFFALSHDLFCIAGFDGRFRRTNDAWRTVLGYAAEELTAHPFIEWVHPDDREDTTAETAYLARGGQTVSFTNRYRAHDGTYRRLLWAAHSDEAEQLIYASARDITSEYEATEQQRALNVELGRQAARLEATNRELEAFSYSVSHDLRAPLRAIDGFSRVIEEEAGDRLPAEAADALQRVQAAARRMGGLIDDLLNLSRVTRSELRHEPVDLTALAGSVVQDLRARDPHRTVSVSIAPGLQATGDARMLRIVLDNLIGNAWKYTSRTPRACVSVTAEPEGGGLAFIVRDNGVGFDMQYAGKLFGAFQRLHSPAEFEGTGIGLALVQRIVTKHGGRISAEAEPGRGATFRFTLAPPQENA